MQVLTSRSRQYVFFSYSMEFGQRNVLVRFCIGGPAYWLRSRRRMQAALGETPSWHKCRFIFRNSRLAVFCKVPRWSPAPHLTLTPASCSDPAPTEAGAAPTALTLPSSECETLSRVLRFGNRPSRCGARHSNVKASWISAAPRRLWTSNMSLPLLRVILAWPARRLEALWPIRQIAG
jgi:hypothetical protein